MEQHTLDLLDLYATQGWTVCDIVKSADSMPTLPAGLTSQTPLIIPVERKTGLSRDNLRSVLGLAPDDRVVTIHSGVSGDGVCNGIVYNLAKKFRQAGIVVCNGGCPSVSGLMREVVEGALSAKGTDLPPLVVVVTEDLLRKDNLGGNYPVGPIRILLLEDAKSADTTDRAHNMNKLGDALLTLPGGWGTYAEYYHYIEQLGENSNTYKSAAVLANLDNFYEGSVLQIKTTIQRKYARFKAALERAGYYTTNPGSLNEAEVVQDIFNMFTRLLEKTPLVEANIPGFKAGTLKTFAEFAPKG